MTTPTTNPIPSSAPQDLLFNAALLDQVVTGSAPSVADRLGASRMTVQGAIDTIRAYNVRGAWAAGTAYALKDLVTNGGVTYVAVVLTHTSGTFATDLAAGKWAVWQGVTLLQLSGYVSGFGSDIVGYTSTRTVKNRLDDAVPVTNYPGVDPTGFTDSSTGIAAALAANKKLFFPDGEYLMNTAVSKAADNLDIDFGNAVIKNGGTGFLFTFGSTSNTPVYSGLLLRGGKFEQVNPATTANQNYIRIAGTKDFEIKSMTCKNVSNGGIYIEAGCEDGLIDGVKIYGKTGYSTCRGIWLNGSTASDYGGGLFVDATSITRNATAFPVYAAKNITIRGCKIIVPNYAVYLMNTRDCTIEGNHIDISGAGATRCIAINDYSPGSKIYGNTLISDRSSTGILITQCSDAVTVFGNIFKGSFGGNRAIFVQYLAEALITHNQFLDDGTQNIEISMGGFAIIENNNFKKPARSADNRCVYAHPIDADGSVLYPTVGDTATVTPGFVFRNNYIKNRCLGVYATTALVPSPAGNLPAFDMIEVRGNTFATMDQAATSSEYPMTLITGTSANVTRYRYDDNVVLPYTAAGRNKTNASGTSFVAEATQAYIAKFSVSVAAAGGSITVTKIAGGNFSLAVTRSGSDIILTPRTISGGSGAVAEPFMPIDLGGTIYRFAVRRSGSNYLLTAYDSAGAAIALNTIAASFTVVIGASVET